MFHDAATGNAGITLVELIITLAVLAILVGGSIPSLTEIIQRNRLAGFVEKLYSDLLAARMEAIKRNKTITLSFTHNKNNRQWCYSLNDNGFCDCEVNGQCLLDKQVSKITSHENYPSISLNARFAQDAVNFHPARGTANAGSIELGSGGNSARVIVSNLGRVRICSSQLPGYAKC